MVALLAVPLSLSGIASMDIVQYDIVGFAQKGVFGVQVPASLESLERYLRCSERNKGM